ncbi:copper chaperone PCu(A)C [Suttonella sp. R2A3]|uniref:copper chaperone PCu(A)C n=1 Tax=Suttonella sp. R2A3 TaxID=2908648 RepID=UPI001F3F5C61|nr:copper chaperone PCu(A)C [Suttonella sp. R2A3]UJF25401.1 copper chaperone PCu(A)C [Suttonella sp. R2A3]
MMRKLAVAILLASGLAQAADVSVSDCVIQEVLPTKMMTGAFVTFNNESDKDIALVSAEIPSISDKIELHEMAVVDGVMKMQEIKQYDLTPGEHQFKKGGYHVMIMGIKEAPEVGSEHEMTFNFADGESVSCQAPVYSIDQVMEHFGMDGKEGGMSHDMKGMDMKEGEMSHDMKDMEKAAESTEHAH